MALADNTDKAAENPLLKWTDTAQRITDEKRRKHIRSSTLANLVPGTPVKMANAKVSYPDGGVSCGRYGCVDFPFVGLIQSIGSGEIGTAFTFSILLYLLYPIPIFL